MPGEAAWFADAAALLLGRDDVPEGRRSGLMGCEKGVLREVWIDSWTVRLRVRAACEIAAV